jgi:hypothetical protein
MDIDDTIKCPLNDFRPCISDCGFYIHEAGCGMFAVHDELVNVVAKLDDIITLANEAGRILLEKEAKRAKKVRVNKP